MSLLTDWREFAYSHDDRTREGQEFWIGYFNQEKAVYEQILATPEEPVSGTVTELAQKYNMELSYFVGFLDGINDSLKNPNPISSLLKKLTNPVFPFSKQGVILANKVSSF